ncbi:uncharacterized protein BDR25DRAFT_356563 [Lindgomyces ingoldianus]|uniref:Uncharacterized protein n=1 Tax=Lindgomyces ingoldianus TaxID=673940 RepID=A0ACB6QTB9_9PLEO|nr:uncharacterized protein BDR25DRAFT_356563 [Lindgomyces ingoldianus]KAF2469327.1 hypothetical protein BDR25DRAFT_356563 [Lindgomyces ingoldianus]
MVELGGKTRREHDIQHGGRKREWSEGFVVVTGQSMLMNFITTDLSKKTTFPYNKSKSYVFLNLTTPRHYRRSQTFTNLLSLLTHPSIALPILVCVNASPLHLNSLFLYTSSKLTSEQKGEEKAQMVRVSPGRLNWCTSGIFGGRVLLLSWKSIMAPMNEKYLDRWILVFCDGVRMSTLHHKGIWKITIRDEAMYRVRSSSECAHEVVLPKSNLGKIFSGCMWVRIPDAGVAFAHLIFPYDPVFSPAQGRVLGLLSRHINPEAEPLIWHNLPDATSPQNSIFQNLYPSHTISSSSNPSTISLTLLVGLYRKPCPPKFACTAAPFDSNPTAGYNLLREIGTSGSVHTQTVS